MTVVKDLYLPSPAKINLGLRVVEKISSGYHLLESLFWPINFVDDLVLNSANQNHVEMAWDCNSPFNKIPLPSEKENLVYRGLEKLNSFWNISIRKRIPMGAGLGGGSSNAGTILRSLNGLHREQTFEIAKSLGADVPFFLDPKPSWVTGVGENIQSLNFGKEIYDKIYFLVVILPKSLSTKNVFTQFDKARLFVSGSGQVCWPTTPQIQNLKTYLQAARNDLEGAAIKLVPLIGEVLDELRRLPTLYSGMTGSGTSCVAAFDSDQLRDECAKEMTRFLRKNYCTGIKAETFRSID